MLRAQSLSLRLRGRLVLDRLDLHVLPGELVALAGPAAAGKTALLETFLGRHAATGSVRVAGLDVAGRPALAAAHLAFVPALLDLPGDLTPLAQLRAVCARLGRRMPDAVLGDALARTGLAAAWHARPLCDAPRGVARQVAFAAATLQNADAFLLDEPHRDLDPAAASALANSLRRLRRRGAAILLATRDLAFAQRLATRVLLLEDGALVETLAPQASREAHAAESYLSALVG
jgi:ABC-2 type transport system ATP-binding protein